MKDWKGNEVQVGDKLVCVEIHHQSAGSTYQTIFSLGNGHPVHVSEEQTMPYEYVWWERLRCEVIEYGHMVELGNGGQIPINHLDFFFPIQHNQILCIEGKSFDRDEYYIHKFSVLTRRFFVLSIKAANSPTCSGVKVGSTVPAITSNPSLFGPRLIAGKMELKKASILL